MRRQIIGWKLADGLLVDVHLQFADELAASPTRHLRNDSALFGGGRMVYGFHLVDLTNRMLVHAFRFQVFYHADEQTLLVADSGERLPPKELVLSPANLPGSPDPRRASGTGPRSTAAAHPTPVE